MQFIQGELPEPDILVVPLGTAAGLLLGFKMCNLKTKVLAVCVDADDTTDVLKELISTIFRTTNNLLSGYSSHIPTFVLSYDDYSIDISHSGSYYAHVAHSTAHLVV